MQVQKKNPPPLKGGGVTQWYQVISKLNMFFMMVFQGICTQLDASTAPGKEIRLSIRPSEIGQYFRVRARMDPRRSRRGANNKFMNENVIPEKIIE